MKFNHLQTLIYRWLLFIGIMHIVLGIALIFIANSSIVEPYITQLFANFNLNVAPHSNTYALFANFLQLFGPTVASWGVLFCLALYHYVHYGSLRTKLLICFALLIWFALDSTLSALNGFYSHLVINSLVFCSVFPAFILLKSNAMNDPFVNNLSIFNEYNIEQKTILVTGGTGFIGQRLVQVLRYLGHDIYVLTRTAHHHKNKNRLNFINHLSDINNDTKIDVIINLAGEPLTSGRWNTKRKQEFLDSRLKVTYEIEQLVGRLKNKPQVLINGSAIGYYGAQKNNPLDESSQFNDCFSHQLCKQWEQAALNITKHSVRVCLLRIGIVLGNNGGPLAQLRLPFEFGASMQIGDGKQWMSWIHKDDLIRAILHIIQNQSIEGPVNATAPTPVTNQEFSMHLSKHIKTIIKIVMPAKVLELIVGELANEVLITGQRVLPKHLEHHQFKFIYPKLGCALTHITHPR